MKEIINNPRVQKIIHHKLFGIIGMLLCVLLGYVLLYNTMGGYLLSNDDTGMMKTVSGYSSGVPSSYHRFICTALGVFFESLYKTNPDVSWYSYVYVSFVIVCISTLLYVMISTLKLKTKWMRILGVFAVIVFIISITLYGIYLISWTETSTFFGAAALVLMISLIYPHSSKTKAAICGVSAVFILLNAFIRDATFLAIAPFYILTAAYVILKNIKQYSIKLHAAFLGLLLVFMGGVYQYTKMDTEYKAAKYETVSLSDFDYYRSQFSDYPVIPFDGNEEFYESIGWDKDFYNLSKNHWMYMDRRFNTDNLRKISEMSKSQNATVTASGAKENVLIQFFSVALPDNQWILLTLMVTGFALLGMTGTVWCWLKKKRKYLIDSLMLSGINLLTILECLYLLNKGRYMFRVFICAAIPALCVSAMMIIGMIVNIDKLAAGNKSDKWPEKIVSYVLIGITVISVLSFVVVSHQDFNSDYKRYRDETNILTTNIERYCVTHKDSLFIHSGVSNNDTLLFLDMRLKGCSQNILFYGGTGIFSSGYYEKVGQFGYSEFYTENLLDDNVYFIDGHRDMENTDFMAYMRAAYGEDITCEQIENIGNRAFVYKFMRG